MEVGVVGDLVAVLGGGGEDAATAVKDILERVMQVLDTQSSAAPRKLRKGLLELLDRPESLIRFVPDRPGHDQRYAIDCSRAESELGWRPEVSFDEGLAATVQWYLENAEWVERIRSGVYREYYQQQYGDRLVDE